MCEFSRYLFHKFVPPPTALQEPEPKPVEAAKKIQVAAPIQSMQPQPMRQAVLL